MLVDAWGNPPDAARDVLGMMFPKRFSPLSKDAWGAVITFDPSGYVKDDDARTADYGKILEDSQKADADSNDERKKQGFEPVQLVGWAEPPSYDSAHHVVIWARDLKFGAGPVDTLNYDIRLLGRKGVLSLNVVAGMPDIAAVHAAAAGVAQMATFNAGDRYADYKQGFDKTAGYGIAGLVAAGVGLAAVKKVGLIGVILLFAKKGIALIAAAFAGAGAWLRKLFGGKPKGGDKSGSDKSGGGGDIVT